MEHYICIHGHFYQPPRENPWLEAIELQDSAYPYHDWNERIASECYAANAASRILDEEGRILQIVNNYAKISFNFGPTLLDWIAKSRPDVYQAIQEADRQSRETFSGHGSALAQAYNHMILPLANRRDRYTQIVWGIRDFRHRFGREPEGMWLPETAVDLETLNVMAELGIRFTILSPYQASRVRSIGARSWTDVSGGRIDPSTPYRINLRAGRHMHLFFYDGPISRDVAFDGLLINAEHFAGRLAGAFSDSRTWPQLVHIATDGETYGHHRRKADMGLAYALHCIQTRGLGCLTNYGEFLARHGAKHEVQIFENSSWSCMHGIERWRSNCGCSSGGHPGWNQNWRAPLREALDWLRDALAPLYAERVRRYVADAWEARNDYISLLLDRSPENLERFLARHARRTLLKDEQVRLLKLLEMQRHCMLMYTSCGWFFDELSGIETVQVIQYAARALQLAEELLGRGLERRFLELLERAQSNLPEHGNGRMVYEKFVRPAMITLEKVGAHYAISSLFEAYASRSRIFCYEVDREDQRTLTAGRIRLVVGKAHIISQITRESELMTFGVLSLGGHSISGGIRRFLGEEQYQATANQLIDTFQRGDVSEMLQSVYQSFGAGTYSLKLLFRDEQRRILRLILDSSLASAEAAYRHIYETDAPLMYFVRSLNIPLPNRLRMAADFVLNTDLRRAFEKINPDVDLIRSLLDEVKRVGTDLDQPTLEYALLRTIDRMSGFLADNPTVLRLLENLNAVVAVARALPFEIELWTAQNVYQKIREQVYPEMQERCEHGEADAITWTGIFRELGANLSFRVE